MRTFLSSANFPFCNRGEAPDLTEGYHPTCENKSDISCEKMQMRSLKSVVFPDFCSEIPHASRWLDDEIGQ